MPRFFSAAFSIDAHPARRLFVQTDRERLFRAVRRPRAGDQTVLRTERERGRGGLLSSLHRRLLADRRGRGHARSARRRARYFFRDRAQEGGQGGGNCASASTKEPLRWPAIEDGGPVVTEHDRRAVRARDPLADQANAARADRHGLSTGRECGVVRRLAAGQLHSPATFERARYSVWPSGRRSRMVGGRPSRRAIPA